MKKVFFIILFGLIFIACKNNQKEELDTQKPSINIISPVSGTKFLTGQNMSIELKFTDNLNLSQYKIEIHPNFDGHSHGKTLNEGVSPWEWDTIVNMDGKEHLSQFQLPIPQNTQAGSYHFSVMCTDAAGYEAPLKFIELTLINPDDTIAPVVNVNYPSVSSENLIEFATGINELPLNLNGTITDNSRVKGVKIQLIESQHGKTQHENEKIIYEYQNFNLNGTSFDLSTINFKLYREDLENDGEYHLIITGYDYVGNSATKEALLHVKLQ